MDLAQALEHVRPTIVQICLSATDLSEDLWKKVGRPFVTHTLDTGFFVNSDGYVITARHAIQGSRQMVEQAEAPALCLHNYKKGLNCPSLIVLEDA